MPHLPRSIPAAMCVAAVLAVSGCELVTADLRAQETAEWRKTYDIAEGGRLEVRNVNGAIDVSPAEGRRVEVVAVKKARGSSPEAAREALARMEIAETSDARGVSIETRLPRGGMFRGGGEVRYTVRVPRNVELSVSTVNGGVEVTGHSGAVRAETTNGGVVLRNVSGAVRASTTNGGVEADVTRVAPDGVHLECTNGGIRLRLPADARGTVSASITNGGIESSGLSLETIESSRRHLDARLNGGGPLIRLEGTNGGIRLSAR